MTNVSILGQIRGAIRPYFGAAGVEIQPMLSDGGAAIVTQGLPERAELVKLGASWGAAIPTGSAYVPVAAWPTTRSELILYNGEATGGPCYIVDRVWASMITVGMTGPIALLGQLVASTAVGATGPAFADTATVLRHQLSGRVSGYAGNARLVLANTTLAIANQWFPLGTSQQTASTVVTSMPGQTVEGQIFGRIIVPPGAAFCMNTIMGLAIGTAILGVEWHEVQLNLG